jgi:hypothetical protein
VTHVGYLVGGYVLTAVVLAAYVARLRWRGRALARAAQPPMRQSPGPGAEPSDPRR